MKLPSFIFLPSRSWRQDARDRRSMKRSIGPRFALLWEEKGHFLINSLSGNMIMSKSDKCWVAHFRTTGPQLYRESQIVLMWKCYEYVRKTQSPDLPPLKIVASSLAHRSQNSPSWFEGVDSALTLSDFLSFRFGRTIGAEIKKLPENFVPRYAIKRKGKSIKTMEYFESDIIVNSGVFSFFQNEEDLVIAKIALGPDVVKNYDFRDAISDYTLTFKAQ